LINNNKISFNYRELNTSKTNDLKKSENISDNKKSIINLNNLISENNNKYIFDNISKDDHSKKKYNKAYSINFKENFYQISLNSEGNKEKYLEDKRFIRLASQVIDKMNFKNNLNIKLTKSLTDIITHNLENIDLKFLFDFQINVPLKSHFPVLKTKISQIWYDLILNDLKYFKLQKKEFIKPIKKNENRSINARLENSSEYDYIGFKEFSRIFFKKLHKKTGNKFDTFKSNSKKDSCKKDSFEERIFNLQYDKNFKIDFERYILIIGFDIFDQELLDKLSFHYNNTKILITGDFYFSKKEEIRKFFHKYKNLYLAVVDLYDPRELEKLNLNKVLKCFLLLKNFDNRVKSDLVNLQLINYFNYNYNFDIYIEQISDLGNFFLGFTPKFNNSTIKDPYYHPLYMSGKIFYISQLKEICAASYMYEQLTEAWLSLINCGYPNKNLSLKGSNPNIITIEIPKIYYNKEYIYLVKDLFLYEDISCIPLGLYYTSPFEIKNAKKNKNKNLENSFSQDIRETEKTTIINCKLNYK